MKTLLISTFLFIAATCFQQVSAQSQASNLDEDFQLDTTKLKSQKSVVETKEKERLKDEIKRINQDLEEGKITTSEAKRQKERAADKHARNIENQLDIIDAHFGLLKRNADDETDSDYYKCMDYLETSADTTETELKPSKTSTGMVVAFGLNNAIGSDRSLDDSPYKIGGSRFFEIGLEFRTVLINSGFLRLNYGLNVQFNGLKPDNDRYFVKEDDQTVLQDFQYDLKKSKLRMDNIVVPLHFEIGPTDDYYEAEKFKLGLGGYAGVNLKTTQKLKYKQDGDKIKNKIVNDYNTNNFIYGLSAYVGYDWFALYVKYDLNTIFKDNPIDSHNVSAGLRFNY